MSTKICWLPSDPKLLPQSCQVTAGYQSGRVLIQLVCIFFFFWAGTISGGVWGVMDSHI